MKRALLDRLNADRAAKRPVALVTELTGGAQSLVTTEQTHGSLALPLSVVASARAGLRSDRSGTVEADGARYFIRVYNPPLRLAVIGAVHIAQALVPMAQLTGYEVIVIDPRSAFGSIERFPGVQLSNDWPDEAMEKLRPDLRTALVTLTHDPKIDDPALISGLRSDVFYIGALGSKKTHASRIERLTAAGFGADDFARIHGPVGLRIGAKSPAEISISILAQMTAALRQPAASANSAAA